MIKKFLILTLCATIGHSVAFGQSNVRVVNPTSSPVPVTIVSGGGGGGGGDASAANQTAVQATAGSDATKAVAVQGITGGKAVSTTSSNLPTTVDTNSGNKSASTIRMVLATDQPALTNKLLVTPDLPSGAATAAKQPALGTAGTASTDVITVQGIASGTAQPVSQSGTWTVQPGNTANTTAWKVDGSAVTQPVSLSGNQAVNVAQINGVTPLMGAGNTGTGSARVTIATDQANVPVAVKTQVGPGTGTTGQVTASTSAATLVASNATRRKLTIKDTDASITVYIGPATVTSSNGMPLKAGESITVTATQLWQVIAASGSPVVAYLDESD